MSFSSLLLALPLAITYAKTGLVPRLPTALLATAIMILAVLSFFCGLILDTVTRGRRETRRLAYLAFAAPPDLLRTSSNLDDQAMVIDEVGNG